MLRAALLAALLLTAGCTMPLDDSPSEQPDSPTVTPIGTVGTPTATCEPVDITARVELRVEDGATARVLIRNDSSDDVVHNRTYDGPTTVEFGDEGRVFQPRTDYLVVIRVNGSAAFNESVIRTQDWALEAHANGTVTKQRPVWVLDTPTRDC